MKTTLKLMRVTLVTSGLVFCAVFATGLVLRTTGPVQISSHLWLASGDGQWLIFFEGHEGRPLFNLMLATGFLRPIRQRNVAFGEGVCFVQEHYLDASGVTQLSTTDFRLPGIFYLHYRSIDTRVLTFALRGWLVLGLSGLLPGLWLLRRIKTYWKAPNQRVEANRRPASPLNAGRLFGSALCAPPFVSAAVAHPCLSTAW